MSEREINVEEIQGQAVSIVQELREVHYFRERTYPSEIQAVLVLSGPGTYTERLKTNEEEWMRYMDRDRIRAGVAVATEVASGKKSFPLLVYNGTPKENRVFREVFNGHNCKIPKDKVFVIDTVRGKNGIHHEIIHTGNQIESLFQEIENPQSPLFGFTNIAVVAHDPDFVRIPFYLYKYNSESATLVNFYYYGLTSRKGTYELHLQSELAKLPEYAARGHLAQMPLIPSK